MGVIIKKRKNKISGTFLFVAGLTLMPACHPEITAKDLGPVQEVRA